MARSFAAMLPLRLNLNDPMEQAKTGQMPNGWTAPAPTGYSIPVCYPTRDVGRGVGEPGSGVSGQAAADYNPPAFDGV